MQQLKKGGPCKVRILTTGQVVDAVYDSPVDITWAKWHYVDRGGLLFTAIDKQRYHNYMEHEVRFVGNPCTLEWV